MTSATPEGPSATLHHRRWRNAVIALFALGGIAVATWGPRLPQIRDALGATDAAIGLALAGVAIGSVVGLAFAPVALSRLGNRRAILFDVLLTAAGIAVVGIAAGVAHSLLLAFGGFTILGFGIGLLDVMVNVEGSSVEQSIGRTLMPLMHAGWSAGSVLGAGIGAAAAALHVSVVFQFACEAILIAVAAAVAVKFLPRSNHAVETMQKQPFGERVTEWLSGWRQRRLLLIGLVMLGVELGEGTANSWLPLAVRDGHQQTEAFAGLVFVLFTASETISRIFGGAIVDRVGRVRAIRITTAIGAVGLVLFILPAPAWVLAIGAILWAFGVSLGFPLGMSAAAEGGPDPASRVRVVASIGYIANLGGPPVIGWLSGQLGILGALWLVVILLGVGFAAAGALASRAAGRT